MDLHGDRPANQSRMRKLMCDVSLARDEVSPYHPAFELLSRPSMMSLDPMKAVRQIALLNATTRIPVRVFPRCSSTDSLFTYSVLFVDNGPPGPRDEI